MFPRRVWVLPGGLSCSPPLQGVPSHIPGGAALPQGRSAPFPCPGEVITELPSWGAGAEAITKPVFAPFEQDWDSPVLRQPVMPLSPPNPQQKQELKLSSPSATPQNPGGRGAGDGAGAAVGKGSVSVLTGDALASSPESHQQQGEQGQGEDLHVQPRAQGTADSGPPRATCLSCLHLGMIYPPARLSMTALDSPRGKNRPEILIKGNR